eukprot:6209679-Pleurochrysis_carterae.AAC.1
MVQGGAGPEPPTIFSDASSPLLGHPRLCSPFAAAVRAQGRRAVCGDLFGRADARVGGAGGPSAAVGLAHALRRQAARRTPKGARARTHAR